MRFLTRKALFIFSLCCIGLLVSIIALDGVFALRSPPSVIDSYPQDQDQRVAATPQIKVQFNKPVRRQKIRPSISPEVHGEWRFENPFIKNHLFQALVFLPINKLKADTKYHITLENIQGFGLPWTTSFQFAFTTRQNPSFAVPQKSETQAISVPQNPAPEPQITMLPIAVDWQDDALSCEAASLKMALTGKSIFVSENEIMEKIGYDVETPRRGETWGDPHQGYVGDIDGKMCKTGFGVYWEPVAVAAKHWRGAEAFSGGTIEDVVREIQAGNPIIVWGSLSNSALTDCSWYTEEGNYIPAFKETHVRVVIGFVGPADNPSKIILNDPLAGRVYWSTDYFLQNWSVFNSSGVVVR